MFRKLGLPILAVVAFSFMSYHLLRTHKHLPDLAPAVAPARAPYQHIVAASGIVEPRGENISVGSPLPGVVVEVPIEEGQTVRAGDLLFRLDDRELRAQLAVRQAELETARSNLARTESSPRPEEIPPSEARVRRAEAQLTAETDLYRRREKLSATQMVSEEELISRRQAVAVARESLAQAQAEHALLLAGSWDRDKQIARAEVARAQSLVDQTKIELGRLEVRAPVAGQVLKVRLRKGEYVGTPPGESLIMLGDLSRLHVRVTIDEQDLPRFRPGRPGKGFVRGDAEKALDLSFVGVEPYVLPKQSLTGSAAERVDTRVLEVIYALPPEVQGVYVGQQLDVFVETDAASPGDGASRALALAAKPLTNAE